jgi:hypothetical protein
MYSQSYPRYFEESDFRGELFTLLGNERRVINHTPCIFIRDAHCQHKVSHYLSSRVTLSTSFCLMPMNWIQCIHIHIWYYYTRLDRESNPQPLAYGNTTSIEGTTTLTTKPNPFYKNRRFNDQGRT